MWRIRPATQQDAVAIAHVHVQAWKTTYAGVVPEDYLATLREADRAAQWREWLTLHLPIHVAEAGDQVVGFASGGPIREPVSGHGDFDAELYAVYLLEDAQGQGTGTALLTAVATSLSETGFHAMLAWVLKSNRASRFYERMGATQIASKQIQIGGASLPALAYGWRDLSALKPSGPS